MVKTGKGDIRDNRLKTDPKIQEAQTSEILRSNAHNLTERTKLSCCLRGSDEVSDAGNC